LKDPCSHEVSESKEIFKAWRRQKSSQNNLKGKNEEKYF